MSHPDVWADAKARIQAVAEGRGLPVEFPNEAPLGAAGIHLKAEIHSSGDAPLELGTAAWEELGHVWVHVRVPSGTGFDLGNAHRHAIGLAFRHPSSLPAGLVYQRIMAPPEETDDEGGNWSRLSLGVAYQYQTITVP